MKNKRFWLGMLVLALAFGMTVVGCGDEEEDSKTPFPTDGTLEEKLTWVSGDNVEDGETYIIEVTADETISGHDISPYKNITIVLKGIGAERKISLGEGGGYLFSVGQYVTLVLDENITLQGRSDNTTSLVIVRGGGLEMKAGAKIIGNTNTASGGGGVYVSNGGTFTMNGGTISGNTATGSSGGGGVYVIGTFTKTGGTIYGYSESDTVNNNVAKNSADAVQNNRGHAVYVNSSPAKHRETTAGPSVNLDSTKTGAEGGWEN